MYKLKRNESTDTYPYRWLNRDNFEENILMKLLRVFLAMLFFAGILAGSLPSFSMVLTRFGFTPARPIKRSTASGGHVAILRVDRMLGVARIVSGRIFRRYDVTWRLDSTEAVAVIRVALNVSGAKSKNHWFYISTDSATSSFQR